MLEGSIGTQDQPRALEDLFQWYRNQRDAQYRFRPEDRRFYKEVQQATQAQILDFSPQLFQDMDTARLMNGFVFSDAPVASFSNSPFARVHVNGRVLRRILVSDALSRTEIIKDVPESIVGAAKSAWIEVTSLPKIETPKIDPQIIEAMASVSTKLGKPTWGHAWSNVALGLTSAELLILRTLAAKFSFSETVGLGYDRTTISLCNQLLQMLEAFSSITPWQLEYSPQGYLENLHRYSTALALRGVDRSDRYFRPGGMWSDQMAARPEIQRWIEALRTGQPPR